MYATAPFLQCIFVTFGQVPVHAQLFLKESVQALRSMIEYAKAPLLHYIFVTFGQVHVWNHALRFHFLLRRSPPLPCRPQPDLSWVQFRVQLAPQVAEAIHCSLRPNDSRFQIVF